MTGLGFLLLLILHTDYSSSYLNTPSTLQHIKQQGVINVITRNSHTTYYERAEGFIGLEYDLVRLFAQQLNVKANFIVLDNFHNISQQLATHKAAIVAAGLTITHHRKQQMRFAPPYQNITEQIMYHDRKNAPKNMADLRNGIIEVAQGSSHNDTLIKLQSQYPQLDWHINTQLNTDDLLHLLDKGLIDYTIIDSHQASLAKQFYPKLYTAFDLTGPRQLAWALPHSNDTSLYDAVSLFFIRIKQDNTLQRLLEKYYGNVGNLNYVSHCAFHQHIKNRLPKYLNLFKTEAKKYNIDWRLLATIGYQESHWRTDTVSPTGVRGIMMLTLSTAKQLHIKDRIDPAQSIAGGALYFKQQLNRLPEHIKEPDRTWFALAAYNTGFGHLQDARMLTKQRKGNPDKWLDVKKSLPLLSQKKWYEQTRHGYARGKEPVRYVDNIRSYYDLLVWRTDTNKKEQKRMALLLKKLLPKKPDYKLLNFMSAAP